MTRLPVFPLTFEAAVKKVRIAEDALNTRVPAKVSLAYTPDTRWKNRFDFINGRDNPASDVSAAAA
jgi:nuclear transport factor 2 (NTF2) superfamily protein